MIIKSMLSIGFDSSSPIAPCELGSITDNEWKAYKQAVGEQHAQFFNECAMFSYPFITGIKFKEFNFPSDYMSGREYIVLEADIDKTKLFLEIDSNVNDFNEWLEDLFSCSILQAPTWSELFVREDAWDFCFDYLMEPYFNSAMPDLIDKCVEEFYRNTEVKEEV